MMLQVKPILSMMGIIIEMKIRTRYYCYWLRLSKILCGHVINTPYKRTLCSRILEP